MILGLCVCMEGGGRGGGDAQIIIGSLSNIEIHAEPGQVEGKPFPSTEVLYKYNEVLETRNKVVFLFFHSAVS